MGKTATGRAEEDVEAAWAAAPQQEAWVAWLVPAFALANTIAFAYTMYVNDCPSSHRLLLGPPYSYYYSSPSSSSSSSTCVFPSLLGRFAFEPFSVNPLLGPSLRTCVILLSLALSLPGLASPPSSFCLLHTAFAYWH